MKRIILLKLGGSLINDKNMPYTARLNVIKSIAAELKLILEKMKDTYFLLGNGAGSFGHYPAEKYKMKEGIQCKEQQYGFAVVQDGVARLNRIVINALLEQGIPACSLHPSTFLTSSQGMKKEIFTQSLFGYLNNKIVPVIYGDIVYDDTLGCRIYSVENLFSLLIPELTEHNYKIEKIIFLTEVAGVLDNNMKVIPVITKDNFKEMQKCIFKTKGYDVTGGMLHKIQTSLEYTGRNIPTYIIKGDTEDKLLTKTVFNEEFTGTVIA